MRGLNSEREKWNSCSGKKELGGRKEEKKKFNKFKCA